MVPAVGICEAHNRLMIFFIEVGDPMGEAEQEVGVTRKRMVKTLGTRLKAGGPQCVVTVRNWPHAERLM